MRWILRLVGVVVSVVLVILAGLFLLPAERLAAIATQQFEAQTGRQLTISGAVRPSIWPTLGARIEGVSLASTPWANSGPLLQAEALDLGVDLASLWRGDLVVRRFEAQGARIILERSAEGFANWTFEGLSSESTGGASSAGGGSLSLENVTIRDAALRYIDHASGLDLSFDGVNIDLAAPDMNGAGSLGINFTTRGQSLDLDAEIAVVSQFLAGEVTPLTLAGNIAGTQIRFDGRAGFSPLAAEGALSLDTRALAPLLALAGQTGAPEPLPAALIPVDFDGRLTIAPSGTYHIREAQLSAGNIRTGLALDLSLAGERPRLTGQVEAGALDLRPLLSGDSSRQAAPAATAQSGWSTARIDASALGALDAEIAINAAPLQTGVVDLDSFSGLLTIDRARAVVQLREARAYGGNLTGELVANNRNGLSVGGNLRAREVGLQPLLRDLADFERLAGAGAFDLRFLGAGQSLDAIMRSLSGEGVVQFGQGEILGLDLLGMLRTMDLSYVGEGQRTLYDQITASFQIAEGVLSNNDLALSSGRFSVAGRGQVNLGAQSLDYRVTPTVLTNAETGESLRVPLIITGPWAAPRFRLDIEGLAEERLREERQRLEARAREEAARLEAEARARIAQEAQDRLGIEIQEGQSTTEALQDGIRQRAEDEIRSGLERLLGRQ